MRIRAYAPADLDPLVALFRRSVHALARRDYTPAQLAAWAPDEIDRDRWGARLAASSTWVAARSESAAGFITLEPPGHIDLLYVDAGLQRRGIASALLARLEAAARTQGLMRLSTEASITARPLFEHRGFEVVGEQTVTRRGQDLRNFRMARSLYEISRNNRA